MYTHINKNNEVEQLYFDGHVERMCSDGKYEVSPSCPTNPLKMVSVCCGIGKSGCHGIDMPCLAGDADGWPG